MKPQNEEFSLKDLFAMFIPKAWIILLCGAVLACGMGIYSVFIKADTYTCTSALISSKQNNNLSTSDVELASKMIDTYKEVVFRDDFLELVCQDINSRGVYPTTIKPALLKSICTIQKCDDTEVFDVIVTSTDPELSYIVCESMSRVIDEKLPEKLPYPSGAVVLNIIQVADRADAFIKNSNNLSRNAIIGFLVGVVVSMIAIYLYSILDIVIRDRKRLEEEFELPVLGVIPRHNVESGSSFDKVKEKV